MSQNNPLVSFLSLFSVNSIVSDSLQAIASLYANERYLHTKGNPRAVQQRGRPNPNTISGIPSTCSHLPKLMLLQCKSPRPTPSLIHLFSCQLAILWFLGFFASLLDKDYFPANNACINGDSDMHIRLKPTSIWILINVDQI
jgi:hypothetical protein